MKDLDRGQIAREQVYLINDSFQNRKQYNIPKAQLVIADIPYNVGNNAYGSSPQWYKDGDNKNGAIDLDIDYSADDFKIAFKIDYLKGILKNTCDNVFDFGFNAPLSAAVIRNGEDVSLIMPVQIRG